GSRAIDEHGHAHRLQWQMTENADGSVRLQASLPEVLPIASVKVTLANPFGPSSTARWVRFFGSDLCSAYGTAHLDKRSLSKLREFRADHQWVSSLGTRLPGHASHLVAAIVDSSQPPDADTLLLGFLPDPANRT